MQPLAISTLSESFAKEYPNLAFGSAWRYLPEPDSDQDVDQAVMAKAHLAVRMSSAPLYAQLVGIEPSVAQAEPFPAADEAVLTFAARGELPVSPVFLDLESEAGTPVAWHAETWPLPLHLRAALCSEVPDWSVGDSVRQRRGCSSSRRN